MTELKQIWKLFNDMLQQNKIKAVSKGEDGVSAMAQVKDTMHRVEIAWVKLERHNARMVKAFSNLTSEASNYDSQTTIRSKK